MNFFEVKKLSKIVPGNSNLLIRAENNRSHLPTECNIAIESNSQKHIKNPNQKTVFILSKEHYANIISDFKLLPLLSLSREETLRWVYERKV